MCMCVCARPGQPGAIGGGLGSGGRRDKVREGWRDRRSAGVSLGKVQVWADVQAERWKGELDGQKGARGLKKGAGRGGGERKALEGLELSR